MKRDSKQPRDISDYNMGPKHKKDLNKESVKHTFIPTTKPNIKSGKKYPIAEP